ncbi:MAG: RtcB family protein, partial [Candidatus Zixiibacteriota bacterium]
GEKPPPNLDFIEESSPEGKRYIEDMTFAMEFARQNRFVMMEVIKDVIACAIPGASFAPVINIHHNYASREEHYGKAVWVHRKGATRVKTDITGIIPGSMAESSYIVHGTDNAESFNSCSHGAGRKMSRRAAKESINLEKLRSQMQGIYSESLSRSVLDEAPDAYKDIESVMANQKDLVTIDTRLRPILNMKA